MMNGDIESAHRNQVETAHALNKANKIMNHLEK
jgi:hypothetical protein